MAETFTFTEWVNGPNMTTNTSGWDAIANQQHKSLHRALLWGETLLARVTDVALSGTSERVVMTVPTGYSVWVSKIILQGSSTASGTLTFSAGEAATGAADDWDNSMAVDLTVGTAATSLVVIEHADTAVDTLPRYTAAQTFGVKRVSGSSPTYDSIEIHGYAYKA